MTHRPGIETMEDRIREDRPGDGLQRFKEQMRRFAELHQSLPIDTRATCPVCGDVVAATFDRAGAQVVLSFHCQKCAPARQVHHDSIWTHNVSDFPGSSTETFSGSRIHPAARRLPRTVETLCPQCSAIIVGRHFVEHGAVFIEKTCPEHGHFRDCVNSDALLYSKTAWWTFEEHPGQQFPQVTGG